jgi:hypothetical protein
VPIDSILSIITNLLKKSRIAVPGSLFEPSNSFGGTLSHQFLEARALRVVDGVIAIELPVWMRTATDRVYTGHVDLLMIKDGTLYVMDYKPNLGIGGLTSFLTAVPQLAAYGILFKQMFGAENVKCAIFNEGGSRTFDPEPALLLANEICRWSQQEYSAWADVLEWETHGGESYPAFATNLYREMGGVVLMSEIGNTGFEFQHVFTSLFKKWYRSQFSLL